MSDPYGSYHANPSAGWPAGPGQQPTITVDRRPGTVTAAAVITIVLSALALVGAVVFAIVVAADRAVVRRQVMDQANGNTYSPQQLDHILNILVGSSVAAMVFSVVAIVAAIGVLRRSKAARIVLTVLAALTIAPAIAASFGLVGLPWLVATITVIVLLYVGGANPWFARRTQQPTFTYPSYPGYPPTY